MVLYSELLQFSYKQVRLLGQPPLKCCLVDLLSGSKGFIMDDAPPLTVHEEVEKVFLVASFGEAPSANMASPLTHRSWVFS